MYPSQKLAIGESQSGVCLTEVSPTSYIACSVNVMQVLNLE